MKWNERVIGCAMSVHRALGAGFLESVYQNALQVEFRTTGIPYEAQKPLKICYKACTIGNYIADFVIDQSLILELKATSAPSKADEQQLVNYLKATGIETGLLINFGTPSLEFKRKIRHLPPKNPVNSVNPVNPV